MPAANVHAMLVQAMCGILDKCRASGERFAIALLGAATTEAVISVETLEQQSNEDSTQEPSTVPPPPAASPYDQAYTSQQFHARLNTDTTIDTVDQLQQFYDANAHLLTCRYGVLLFMYSVLFTKTLPAIVDELADTTEPLIHNVYGYASQALINLVLTGRAVLNVWDNEQDVGGLSGC